LTRLAFDQVVGVGTHRVIALLGDDDGDGTAGLDLADVAQQFGVQHRRTDDTVDHSRYANAFEDHRPLGAGRARASTAR
jgi:hypothetical protein